MIKYLREKNDVRQIEILETLEVESKVMILSAKEEDALIYLSYIERDHTQIKHKIMSMHSTQADAATHCEYEEYEQIKRHVHLPKTIDLKEAKAQHVMLKNPIRRMVLNCNIYPTYQEALNHHENHG